MTQAANWDTRWNVQKQHIVWRETFYEVKFNVLQKAYAHFRMMFVNKDTIIGANCTLATHVRDHGTAANFAQKIGDTAFRANKGISFVDGLKSTGAWAIRAPFLLVAGAGAIVMVAGSLVVTGMQEIIVRLPGSVE